MADILVGKKMMGKLASTMAELNGSSSETFGKRMLEKMGWKSGDGLGKEGQGMTEHVKVKKREEAVGLGADAKERMDDTWWSDVYNKHATRTDKKGRKVAKSERAAVSTAAPTDAELFAACGGIRLGMRSRGSCNGKLLRADGGAGVKESVKDKLKLTQEERSERKAAKKAKREAKVAKRTARIAAKVAKKEAKRAEKVAKKEGKKRKAASSSSDRDNDGDETAPKRVRTRSMDKK